jgi:hypothetical protein
MRYLSTLAALVLVIAFGLYEGLWTNRWGFAQDTEKAAARLVNIPKVVGEWQGEDHELDRRQIEASEMTGYLMRRYTHAGSGASVTVALICGRPGPTSVHTPDICYGGAGFTQEKPEERRQLQDAELWVGLFKKESEALRIYWGWSANGEWSAPSNARVTFGRERALYKLYVQRQLASADEPLNEDPSEDFLRAFLPEVNRCLFSKE